MKMIKCLGVKCDLSMSVYHLVWKIFSFLSFLVVLTELGILITFLDFRSHYLSIIRLDELIRETTYKLFMKPKRGKRFNGNNNKTVSSLSPLQHKKPCWYVIFLTTYHWLNFDGNFKLVLYLRDGYKVATIMVCWK